MICLLSTFFGFSGELDVTFFSTEKGNNDHVRPRIQHDEKIFPVFPALKSRIFNDQVGTYKGYMLPKATWRNVVMGFSLERLLTP